MTISHMKLTLSYAIAIISVLNGFQTTTSMKRNIDFAGVSVVRSFANTIDAFESYDEDVDNSLYDNNHEDYFYANEFIAEEFFTTEKPSVIQDITEKQLAHKTNLDATKEFQEASSTTTTTTTATTTTTTRTHSRTTAFSTKSSLSSQSPSTPTVAPFFSTFETTTGTSNDFDSDVQKGWEIKRLPDGGYDLHIESENASRHETASIVQVLNEREAKALEDGDFRKPQSTLRVKGTSRWKDKTGVETIIRYEADENGYRAFGPAIPTPWPLESLPRLLREGILLNLRVAAKRKAKGLDGFSGKSTKSEREKRSRQIWKGRKLI